VPAGRPSEYTQEVADAICAELAEGKSLRSVCKAESMPCIRTVFTWMRTYPEFLQQYARAKEESADALTDEMLDIADDTARDFAEGENGPVFNSEHVQRSRLRVDTRKWIASKLKPKKYGDKIAVGGADDLPAMRVVLANQDASL
jgi:hypothetical protein